MAQLGDYSYTALSGLTTNATSPVVDLSGLSPVGGPVTQITIVGTATVAIQSSQNLSTWVTVATLTSSDIYVLDPRGMYYRFDVSGNTGSVSAIVGPGTLADGQMCGVRGLMSNSGGQSFGGNVLQPPTGVTTTGSPTASQVAVFVDDSTITGVTPSGTGSPVGTGRTINTTAPLTGGGNLSADRTLGISITPTNPGGAVALQATTPGTQQTGNTNISGTSIVGADLNVGTYEQFTAQGSAPAAPGTGFARIYSRTANGVTRLAQKSDLGNELVFFRDSVQRVRNNNGTSITKGQVVEVFGTSGAVPSVRLAKANAASTAQAFGIVLTASIADNALGTVQTQGIISGLDTSGFVAGDELYLSAATAGLLTNVAPTSPNYVCHMGHVITVDPATGDVFLEIRPQVFGVAAGQLPNPSITTLGGVLASTIISGSFVDGIQTDGTPHLAVLPTSPSGQVAVGVTRTITTTAPITIDGTTSADLSADRTIAIAITPTNPGGAVALQAATPGTQQTGNINVSGAIISGATTFMYGRLATANVNLNSATDQAIFTMPSSGFTGCVIMDVAARGFSATGTTAKWGYGASGTPTDWLADQTFAGALTTKSVVLSGRGAAGTTKYGPSTQFVAHVTIAQGAPCTVDVDVYGYYY